MDEHVSKKPIVKNPVKARGAVRGHNVRYVLAFSLGSALLSGSF
jgi:hypothetical protein